MRTLIALLTVLVLVSGVAITGSRAQPLSGARSPAFSICQPNLPRVPDRVRCLPAIKVAVEGLERDYGDNLDYGQANEIGGDFDSPDWPVRAALKILEVAWKAVVTELVERGMERIFGAAPMTDTIVPDEFIIFDPLQ